MLHKVSVLREKSARYAGMQRRRLYIICIIPHFFA